VHERVADGVEDDAPCRYGEAPEVEPAPSLEQGENVDIKFEEVVKCYAQEDGRNGLGDHDVDCHREARECVRKKQSTKRKVEFESGSGDRLHKTCSASS